MSFGKYAVGDTVMATILKHVADSVEKPGYKEAFQALATTAQSGVICKMKRVTKHDKSEYHSLGVSFLLSHRDKGEQEVSIPLESVNILAIEEKVFG